MKCAIANGALALVAALLTAVDASANDKCSSASAYLMGRRPANFKSLSSAESQLVLADLAGVSQHYGASVEEIETVADVLGSDLFQREVSGVIVVENGDKLVLEKETPLFALAQSPAGGFFENIARNVASTSALFHHRFFGVVDMYDSELLKRGGNNHRQHAVEEDLSRLIALESLDEPFIMHIESLKTVSEDGLQSASEKLSKGLEQLASTRDDGQILVLAVPSNVCTDNSKLKRILVAEDNLPENVMYGTGSTITVVGINDDLLDVQKRKPAKISGFVSKAECEENTNNCSGRGSCIRSSGSFVCACEASYDKDKKKTTRYGGFACQKKDVSAETQMFLWTGVGIIITIVAGVSLMYSLDSEPLPGVLGVARKPNL